MTEQSKLEWTEYKSRFRAMTDYGTYWIEASPSGTGYCLICDTTPCCSVFSSPQRAQKYAQQIHNHPVERKVCFGLTDVGQAPYQDHTHVNLTDLLRSYEILLTGDNLPERVAVQTTDLRTFLEAAHPHRLTVAREQTYAHASRITETYINGEYEAQGCAAQMIFDELRVLAKPAPSPSIGAYIWKIVDEMAVDNFTLRMKEKLAKKRAEGRSGWWNMTADDLSVMLRQHVDKGDPVDVANLCMFLSANDQHIAPDTKLVDVTVWAKDLLSIWDQWICCDRSDIETKEQADLLLRSACFATQAYEDAMSYAITADGAPAVLMRTFFIALADQNSPELDPYRAKNRPQTTTLTDEGAKLVDAAVVRGTIFREGVEVAAKWHESEAEYYEKRLGDKDGVPFPIVAGWHRLHAERIRALSAEPAQSVRPLEEWHEDHGNVVWWAWDNDKKEWFGEPAFIGKPLDSDWPEYHTHWTPHPAFPAAPATEAGK